MYSIYYKRSPSKACEGSLLSNVAFHKLNATLLVCLKLKRYNLLQSYEQRLAVLLMRIKTEAL